MKPDWKDAPEWARYLGFDEKGMWWWFENEPEWGHDGTEYGYCFSYNGRSKEASEWPGYIENRP